MAYIVLDFGFIYWVAHWFFKLPAPLNKNVPLALFGLGARLKEGFGLVPQMTQQQAPPNVNRNEGF